MNQLAAWPPSPSTVLGIAGIVGTLASAATGQMTWANAVPLMAASVTAILLPDNANAKAAAQKLAADALVANAMGNAPVLVADADSLAQAVIDASNAPAAAAAADAHAVEPVTPAPALSQASAKPSGR